MNVSEFTLSLGPEEKIKWTRLVNMGLDLKEALSAFKLPLHVCENLPSTESKELVLSLDLDWKNFPLVSHYAPEVMMGADPYVFYNSGALLCQGGRFGSIKLAHAHAPTSRLKTAFHVLTKYLFHVSLNFLSGLSCISIKSKITLD